MATGASSNQLRSAYIKETAIGTTPTTPAFTTGDPFMLTAGAVLASKRSLPAGGGRDASTPASLPVAGTKRGMLIYGREDDLLETLLQGAWTADVLKDGKTPKTVSVENAIPAGVGGTTTMMRYRGVQAVGGSLIMEANREIEYSFDLRGIGSDDASTSIITGATYSDPTVDVPMVASFDVSVLTVGGGTLDGIQRCEVLFNYEDRTDQPVVGNSFDLNGITPGAFLPEIRLRCFVDANFAAIYNSARDEDVAFVCDINLGRTAGSKYTIDFPDCHFGPSALDFSGAEGFHDIVVLPNYDPTGDSAICKITRAVS